MPERFRPTTIYWRQPRNRSAGNLALIAGPVAVNAGEGAKALVNSTIGSWDNGFRIDADVDGYGPCFGGGCDGCCHGGHVGGVG